MTKWIRRVLAVGLMCAFAAPASAQNARERQMMADIRMLQEQTQQLQTQLMAAITTLTDALKAINGRIDDQSNINRKAFADQKLAIDQHGTDLRVVRERVDETNVRIAQITQEVEALRQAIPQYPPPTAPAAEIDPNAPRTQPTPPTTTPPAPQPSGVGAVSPQRLYDTAWADYTAGQWELCIDGFNTYLRSFPRSEQADEAQYYIGQCYFSGNKFSEAVEAYTRVITTYPKGDVVPLAYYQRGIAFERLTQLDRARESFETVLKNFPDHDAARLAKQRLDGLNRRPK